MIIKSDVKITGKRPTWNGKGLALLEEIMGGGSLTVVTTIPPNTDGNDGDVVLVENVGIYQRQGGTWINVGNLSGGGSAYYFTQFVPATTWVIPHNLNRDVSVFVWDAGGSGLFCNSKKIDSNTLILTFGTAIAGSAVVQ